MKRGAQNEVKQSKLNLFERLKSSTEEKEKLVVLLELIGVQPDNYLDRYDTNIKFIKENDRMKQSFEKTVYENLLEENEKVIEEEKNTISVQECHDVSKDVKPSKIREAMEQIVKTYNKIKEYIKEGLGIGR